MSKKKQIHKLLVEHNRLEVVVLNQKEQIAELESKVDELMTCFYGMDLEEQTPINAKDAN